MPSGNQPDLCPETAGRAGLGSVGDEQGRTTSLLSSQILGLETPGLADSTALQQISRKTMWTSAEAGA